VDCSQRHVVVTDSGAIANHLLPGFERIVSERDARPEIIQIAEDVFIFPAQAIAKRQIRF
jgi:hypothetical protein